MLWMKISFVIWNVFLSSDSLYILFTSLISENHIQYASKIWLDKLTNLFGCSMGSIWNNMEVYRDNFHYLFCSTYVITKLRKKFVSIFDNIMHVFLSNMIPYSMNFWYQLIKWFHQHMLVQIIKQNYVAHLSINSTTVL